MMNHYNPKKMVISAAGKINHDEFVEMIKKSCTKLPVGNANYREKANYISGEYREEKKLEQIHLAIGFEGIDFHHEDYYSLDIYASLLGGGMSSRLFQEIREKRGLVYGIQSFSSSYSDTGIFAIYCGTGEKQIEELIPVLCDELNNSPSSISEQEINRGKKSLKASLMMSRESSNTRCRSAANHLLNFNRIIEPSETLSKIDAVSKESVERIAKQIMKGKITISSIGPIKNLEKVEQIQSRLN
jgi:predicted Zn-dependent peptidase